MLRTSNIERSAPAAGARTPSVIPDGDLKGTPICRLGQSDLVMQARVYFRRAPAVQRAILAELDRRRRESPRAQGTKARRVNGMDLFLGNLPFSMTEGEIEYELSKRFGPVVDACIFKTPEGDSRGMGAVRLLNESDGQAALKAGCFEYCGRTIYIRTRMMRGK